MQKPSLIATTDKKCGLNLWAPYNILGLDSFLNRTSTYTTRKFSRQMSNRYLLHLIMWLGLSSTTHLFTTLLKLSVTITSYILYLTIDLLKCSIPLGMRIMDLNSYFAIVIEGVNRKTLASLTAHNSIDIPAFAYVTSSYNNPTVIIR